MFKQIIEVINYDVDMLKFFLKKKSRYIILLLYSIFLQTIVDFIILLFI